MHYVRNVHFQVKNGKNDEFTKMFRTEVLPVLKQQKGFREGLAMQNDDRWMSVSVWDDRNLAETYHKTTFPQLVQKLTPWLEGTPKVETYDLAITTLKS